MYVSDLHCPTCGAEELHPTEHKLLIRGFKIQDEAGKWLSHCLVCAGYYDEHLVELPTPTHPNLGWF